MDDIIQVEEQFYILASSALTDDRTRVLKQGETFAVFDRYGDIVPLGLHEQGVYHEGTRFLSRLELRIGKDRPLLLSSTVKEDNALFAADLTNPDMNLGGHVVLPRGTLHMFRSKFLWHGICYERLRIWNYGLGKCDILFSLHYAVDFHDIFEVRGVRRERRGEKLEPVVTHNHVVLGYRGLDGVVRRAQLDFNPKPKEICANAAYFYTQLDPQAEQTFYFAVSCITGEKQEEKMDYNLAFNEEAEALGARLGDCHLSSSNQQFNDFIKRSISDLNMMITETPDGPYPYAGVPWFSTSFGRDGIITAFESLTLYPEMARGVLSFLAKHQARELIPEIDAEPGKILHESRKGEMAALGEIPFGKYYGSVDSTPLFVMLAGAYYERTGDRAFIQKIWPNILSAIRWIHEFGDQDRDGFVEYTRRSANGLVQQGWKDSHDSVFHEDGTLAERSVALCEVQGYVYGAKVAAAEIALSLGEREIAKKLLFESEVLRERFEKAFWDEELSLYVIALDGDKRPCRVRSSNAGHALFTGIASRDLALKMAQQFGGREFFSGWGVRTIASTEVRYNPMSYHNGSIWPHDNALIAAGMGRYGFKDMALKILGGMFDASLYLDLRRLPELFCGFHRRRGEGPTAYPVACAPQAWAAGSLFMILQACLGLTVKAAEKKIYFHYPKLPNYIDTLFIQNMTIGDSVVDLQLERFRDDVSINVTRRSGALQVVTVK